jgi:hypothetical protein
MIFAPLSFDTCFSILLLATRALADDYLVSERVRQQHQRKRFVDEDGNYNICELRIIEPLLFVSLIRKFPILQQYTT